MFTICVKNQLKDKTWLFIHSYWVGVKTPKRHLSNTSWHYFGNINTKLITFF